MANNFICPDCGFKGEPKHVKDGCIAIEVMLWICFIVPGLIYSIWRVTTRHDVCPECEVTSNCQVRQ